MSARPLEIVVVDDEIQITELICTFIEYSGVVSNVHAFNNPVEAKEYLASHSPDILITDYKMKDINGLQLLEESRPEVKKILISGYISEIAQERLRALNAVCFEKPVPMQALGQVLAEEGARVA